MTAEIGILNKSAAVLAADSAVTIGKNQKVFNTANKIYQLSCNDSIGIMMYNSANWQDVPLEVIIKIYREKFNTPFPTLKEYVLDFVNFLDKTFINNISTDKRNEFIEILLYDLMEFINESSSRFINSEIAESRIDSPTTEEEENALKEEHFILFAKRFLKNISGEPKSERFKKYRLSSFKKRYSSLCKEVIDNFNKSNNIQSKEEVFDLLVKTLYKTLISKIDSKAPYSGIVFAGYGVDEIFPSIIELRLSNIINDTIKIEIVREMQISDKNSAIIAPFAQREMVDIFISGIDPYLLREVSNTLKDFSQKFVTKLHEKYKGRVSKKFMNETIRKMQDDFIEHIEEKSREVHIKPVIDTIQVLRKEELAEIAESLVGITTLKRKASLEIETVGGPIDIAVITKGEGFIWVKRKEIIKNDFNSLNNYQGCVYLKEENLVVSRK